MGTIYSWNAETTADTAPAGGDWVLIFDTSTGRTKKCRVGSLSWGAGSTLGFYGVSAVDQGTMTASALTALATAVISVANTATVFGFANSTVCAAYIKRMSQIQVDLDVLMQKVNSTGVVAVTGL